MDERADIDPVASRVRDAYHSGRWATVATFAAAIGLTRDVVTNWFTARSAPSWTKLAHREAISKLAELTGRPESWFWGRDPAALEEGRAAAGAYAAGLRAAPEGGHADRLVAAVAHLAASAANPAATPEERAAHAAVAKQLLDEIARGV